MSPNPTILLLGTCDTKLQEILYTRDRIVSHGSCSVLVMDVGRTPISHDAIDITQREIIINATTASSTTTTTATPPPPPSTDATRGRSTGSSSSSSSSSGSSNDGTKYPIVTDLHTLSRAQYIKKIISCAVPRVADLYRSGTIHAVIGIGGSSGTALATAVMRTALPLGVPKLMVSTMASGDVKLYVEETDITMMYSVVDIAGTNSILNRILSNAAAAIVGMAVDFANITTAATTTTTTTTTGQPKMRVGITMFGVTTPCVDRIREYLSREHGYEIYVFHATGSGGKAMERLITEGQLDAVIDLTTTEIADLVVGGVLPAGPDRLEAAANAGIPQIISLGACDMVNFGSRSSVPVDFSFDGNGDRSRLLQEHNPSVTLMRTTQDECRQIAQFIAWKLLSASRPELIRVVLPLGGVSMVDTPGQSFYDPDADAVLFSTLEAELRGSSVRVCRDSRAINDEGFAVSVAKLLVELVRGQGSEE